MNSDSDIGVSSRNNGTWSCSLCKYENVDPTSNRCALCGTQQQQESQSKGISALVFSSYASSSPSHKHKSPKVQKQHNSPSSKSSSKSSDRAAIARLVTPERGIDSGLTPAPVILRSHVDPPKADAPTTTGHKSETMGSIPAGSNYLNQNLNQNQNVFRKAENHTTSMEEAEKSDKVAPLSSLKASANSISIRLLDLASHNSADSASGHGSQEEFGGHSAATLSVFNDVARTRHSEVTIRMSNVHGTHKNKDKDNNTDTDDDSVGIPEHFDRATSGEVSLNELYAKGVVPDALTADLTAKHTKKYGSSSSPSNQSPRGVPQSREEDTKEGAWVPLVISISPDDHKKDIEANHFQIENPPDEMCVGETEPQLPTSFRTNIVRVAFVMLVLLVVVVSVALSVGDDADGDVSVFDRVIVLPTATPTMTPTMSAAPHPSLLPSTSHPTMPPTKIPVDVPTAAPVPITPAPVTASPSPLPTRLPTNRPTVAPTQTPAPTTNRPTTPPTAEPTIALTTDFVAGTNFTGLAANDRFGVAVTLSSEGSLLAASSLAAGDPIRVFALENGSWNSLNTVPSDPSNTISGVSTLAIASAGGIPVVAVAYDSFFRVLEYVNGSWRSRGQASIPWVSADSVVEVSVAIAAVQLSSNASVLAAASLNESGNAIVVRVFAYNGASQQWELRGDPISRVRPTDASGGFLSLSFALSGDGQVVAIADWVISSIPQVSIGAFAWTGSDWAQRAGSALSLVFGPAVVALSEDGGVLAVAARSPGTTRVHQWVNDSSWSQVGGDLASGSSIATTKSGLRLVIGNSISSRVSIQDFRDGAWVAAVPLNGATQSQFGSSVDVSSDGNTVVVGSPLDDGNGNNAGRVDIFA